MEGCVLVLAVALTTLGKPFHLTEPQFLSKYKRRIERVGEDVEKLDSLYTAGGTVK